MSARPSRLQSLNVVVGQYLLYMPASCVSIAFYIARSRRTRKKNGDSIQPCCTTDRMVKKSVAPVSVLRQQLESVYNAVNIFMYFCGTPCMDNMFHNDGL